MCGATNLPKNSYSNGISIYKSGAASNVSFMPANKFSGETIFVETKLTNNFAIYATSFGALKFRRCLQIQHS